MYQAGPARSMRGLELLVVGAGGAFLAVTVWRFRRRVSHDEPAALALESTTGIPPMLKNQVRLPRWPLPTLDETLARYLEIMRTVEAGDRAYAATEAFVKEALVSGSAMRKLQARLVAYDKSTVSRSYITDFWEKVYFGGREGITVHSSPGIGLKMDCFSPGVTSQVQRAACMLAATASFAVQVESGTLPPSDMRGTPLDMVQYTRIFASCRLPREGCDVQYKAQKGVGHVIVLRGADMWRVQIVDTATGRPLSVPMLERQLQYVVEHAPCTATPSNEPPPLSVLTTDDRDVWAKARQELVAASPVNAANMRAIDDALVHVCLDLQTVRRDGEECSGSSGGNGFYQTRVRSYLHGHARLAPRWYDKSAVLMLSADEAAVPMALMEHSCYDGLAAFGWYGQIMRRVRTSDYAHPADGKEAAPLPQRLDFSTPASVAAAAHSAERKLDALAASLSVGSLRFNTFGSDKLKTLGASPDGIVQQGFQLAFQRCNGRQPNTYETCAMLQYAGGRTETLRPRTAASLAFVQAVVTGAPMSEQAERLRAAAKAHGVIGRDASAGRGIDRHLFALKSVCALEPPLTLPSVFTDPAHGDFSQFELSTSNMTDAEIVETPWAFGPTHPRGIGCCYNLAPKELAFTATAFAPQVYGPLNTSRAHRGMCTDAA